MRNETVLAPAVDEVIVSRDSRIFYFKFSNAVLCAFHSPAFATYAVALISDTSPRGISKKIAEVTREIKTRFNSETLNGFRVKLIGPSSAIDVSKSVLSEMKIELHTAFETDGNTDTEVYAYCPSGRLRVKAKETSSMTKRKRVFIVDDSQTIRILLTKILSRDPRLEVIGSTGSPLEAERLISKLNPDVVTLDVHMPELNGVELLRRLMSDRKRPVVMISSLGIDDSPYILQALELGAVDYIQKPSMHDLSEAASGIMEKVWTAASAKIQRTSSAIIQSQDIRLDCSVPWAIGSSTGGTEALRTLFQKMPAEIPPIVVVQHIPPIFSNALAARLNSLFPFEVKEAEDGDVIQKGRVLIAPGGKHMVVSKEGPGFGVVRILDTPPVNRHKPSVDVLMESVAQTWGHRSVGVILTGMGSDGAKSLLMMRRKNAFTVAQDEASCVVFGMPKAAIEMGAAELVRGLDEIPAAVMQAGIKRKTA